MHFRIANLYILFVLLLATLTSRVPPSRNLRSYLSLYLGLLSSSLASLVLTDISTQISCSALNLFPTTGRPITKSARSEIGLEIGGHRGHCATYFSVREKEHELQQQWYNDLFLPLRSKS